MKSQNGHGFAAETPVAFSQKLGFQVSQIDPNGFTFGSLPGIDLKTRVNGEFSRWQRSVFGS